MFLRSLRVVFDGIVWRKVKAHLFGHLAQCACSLLIQLDQRQQLENRPRLGKKGQEMRVDLVGRHSRQVLPVHPQQLLGIEDSRSFVHLRQIEKRGRFLAGENLAVAARRPAKQRQEIEQRIGQDSHVAVFLRGGCSRALAKAFPIGA